jgi:hypothetical protein
VPADAGEDRLPRLLDGRLCSPGFSLADHAPPASSVEVALAPAQEVD